MGADMSETRIHPTAIVEPGAELGVGVEVGAFCIVSAHSKIGDRTKLHPHVQIQNRTAIGEENEIYAGAVIGGTPQDKSYHGEATEVEVGDRNQIRENVTIHLGTVKGGKLTTVGSDNLIMGGTHVAHDCQLGNKIVIGNNSLLAGHVKIEDGATVAGGAGIHHWSTIGCLAMVAALARIAMDVPPYLIVEGRPGRVRGLNLVALKRNGINGSDLDALREAYKQLYHTSEPRGAAMRKLEESSHWTTEVQRLVTNLRRSDQGYRGRYLEGLHRGHEPIPEEESGDDYRNKAI